MKWNGEWQKWRESRHVRCCWIAFICECSGRNYCTFCNDPWDDRWNTSLLGHTHVTFLTRPGEHEGTNTYHMYWSWYLVPGTYLALNTILLLCHSSSLVVMKIHVVRGIPVLYSVYTYIDYTVYVNLHRGIILGSPRPRYGGTGTGTRSTAYTGMYHSRLQFCTSIPIVWNAYQDWLKRRIVPGTGTVANNYTGISKWLPVLADKMSSLHHRPLHHHRRYWYPWYQVVITENAGIRWETNTYCL